MPEDIVIRNCSPTLAGIKTGNMFTVSVTNGNDIREEVRDLNSRLGDKGLKAIRLKQTDTYALIYVYRPEYLKHDLKHPTAVRILEKKGYDCSDPEHCVLQLKRHMEKDREFPHEVGLFLGYPPSDVECFMKDPCNGVKCCGCWKAYSDPEEAAARFVRYKKCTEMFSKMNKQGKTLAQLAVTTGKKRSRMNKQEVLT